MHRLWPWLVLFLCILHAWDPPSSPASPGPMRKVIAIRNVTAVSAGVLLEASLSPDTSRTAEMAKPFFVRITLPVDGDVRLEAATADLMDSLTVPAPPASAVRMTKTAETITLQRNGVAVVIGQSPFSLSITGPSTRIGFGDTSTGYVIHARWDTATGFMHDAWLSLAVPSTTVFYGGMPAGARLNNLYANGSNLVYFGPELMPQPVAGTNPPPPSPIAPVFVTNTGWAMRLPPLRSVSFDLGGRGEIGSLRTSLDVTFTLPFGTRRSAAAGTAPPSELLARALATSWLPPVPTGIAFDPAISRDSQMNEQFLAALYIRARSMDIPVNILWMEEWRTSPELIFRRAIPGIGDTFGLPSLTPVNESTSVYRMAWTGSLADDFDCLRTTVRSALIAGLGGFPATGYDLHAYLARTGEDADHPSDDLYRRWTQLLAFSPVMQLHGRRYTHEPWLLANSTIASHFRDYAWLHVNLKPYLEHTARMAGPGRPMMRAPVLAWPRDTETWNIDDAYMLGDDLYVAPVLDDNKSARPVYLPPGRWFDLWNEGRLNGGRWLASFPAPPEQIPVFVRAGSVLPLALDHTYTPSLPIRDTPHLTLRFYPDASGGAGGSLRRGSSSLASRLVAGARGSRSIRLSQTHEPVTIWLPETLAAPRRVSVAGKNLPQIFSWQTLAAGEGWIWDPDLQRLLVRLLPGPARILTVAR